MDLSKLSPPPVFLARGFQSGRVPGSRWPRTRSLALGYSQGMLGGVFSCPLGLEAGALPAQQLCTHTWLSQENKEE